MATIIDDSDLKYGAKMSEIAVRRGLVRGMRIAVYKARGEAVRLCPVGETGRLRGSLTTDIVETPRGVEGSIGTNVEYAPYVEFGTGIEGAATNPSFFGESVQHSSDRKGQKAQPFLRPTLYNKESEIYQDIKNAIWEELKKAL